MNEESNGHLSPPPATTPTTSDDTFSKLNETVQSQIIAAEQAKKSSEGGWFGKVFGVNPVNASLHIGFLIVLILLVLLIAIIVKDVHSDLIEKIFSIVTLFLGYLFGKGHE